MTVSSNIVPLHLTLKFQISLFQWYSAVLPWECCCIFPWWTLNLCLQFFSADVWEILLSLFAWRQMTLLLTQHNSRVFNNFSEHIIDNVNEYGRGRQSWSQAHSASITWIFPKYIQMTLPIILHFWSKLLKLTCQTIFYFILCSQPDNLFIHLMNTIYPLHSVKEEVPSEEASFLPLEELILYKMRECEEY